MVFVKHSRFLLSGWVQKRLGLLIGEAPML